MMSMWGRFLDIRIGSHWIGYRRSLSTMSCPSPCVSLILLRERVAHSSSIWHWRLCAGDLSTEVKVWLCIVMLLLELKLMGFHIFFKGRSASPANLSDWAALVRVKLCLIFSCSFHLFELWISISNSMKNHFWGFGVLGFWGFGL